MSLQLVNFRYFRITHYLKCAQPSCQKEIVAVIIPTYFIHLKLELLFKPNLVVLTINETNQIIFIANRFTMVLYKTKKRPDSIAVKVRGLNVETKSYCFAFWRPRNIQIFSFSLHSSLCFPRSDIPYSDCFIAGSGGEEGGIGRMPH